MKHKVLIPSAFIQKAGTILVIETEGKTIGEVLENVITIHSDLRKSLFDERGRIRSMLNIYINDEDIKYLNDENTVIREDDVITILPSITGGGD